MITYEDKVTMDLNADLGEYTNKGELDHELKLLEIVTSCNIACGGHIGDEASISTIISAAKGLGVAVGPHPSYPDIIGFGRRSIEISKHDLKDSLFSQIKSFLDVAKKHDASVRHIKLHGQLYNDVSKSRELSKVFISAIKDHDLSLNVVGPFGSVTEEVCIKYELPFIPEAFVDRRYNQNLSLVSRREKHALIDSIDARISQAKMIALDQSVFIDGKRLNIHAQTLCIHGDTPNALESAQLIKAELESEGVKLKYYG